MVKKSLILYIAMSLDGFIAKKDGNLDWLTKYDDNSEDYGFKALYDGIETVLIGSITYFQIEDAYDGKEVYVFSNSKHEAGAGNVHFVSGEVGEVFNDLKPDSGGIWLVGGANLVNQFVKEDLIDEYIITVIPTVLGSGISLFDNENPEIDLKLLDVKQYDSGLVQLHYGKFSH
jgi:dihydrofolate reductase